MQADTGPIGGDLSHEFIILAETGESQVYCHRDLLDMPAPGEVDFSSDLTPHVEARTKLYAATEEKHSESSFQAIPEAKRISARGIEVGHIFYFGEKYSAPMGANVTMADGQMRPVHMGSYGIGVSRLVGAIIEACHDDAGVIWPETVAPFHVGIVHLRPGDSACDAAVSKLEALFTARRVKFLTDDTDERGGAKFACMDLIGLPYAVTVGPKGAASGMIEIKHRRTGEKKEMPLVDGANFIIHALSEAGAI
jgi:prolyl-tRNA synthetase